MSSCDVGNHRSFPDHISIQELSTQALLVDSAHRNISLEDFGKNMSSFLMSDLSSFLMSSDVTWL